MEAIRSSQGEKREKTKSFQGFKKKGYFSPDPASGDVKYQERPKWEDLIRWVAVRRHVRIFSEVGD